MANKKTTPSKPSNPTPVPTKQEPAEKAAHRSASRALPERVRATKKAVESNEGSFWAQLAQVAAKPTPLEQVIAAIARKPVGVKAKMTPAQRLQSVGVRVRFAVRHGYLAAA
jgi:hypothetical protein